MRVVITGGTGFIGAALTEMLIARGDEVVLLSRQALRDRPGCRHVGSLDEVAATEAVDAVVNLAGASLAARRWSAPYRREIVASRLDTTREVLDMVSRLQRPPECLLSASAVGYYGHHGDEKLTESSAVTPGFAQKLCHDWEVLALQAARQGVRVCLLRLGVVLDQDGGALAEMAKSFRFGVASWLGSGRQWLSWVHRADVIRAMAFLLARNDLQGPFNITAPEPVTGRGFAAALRAHHHTFIRAGVPAPVARLLVGEMADELLLNGQRVVPDGLLAAGFDFRYPGLEAALAAIYDAQTTLRTRNASG
ncbi:MAG: TIGR01777 family oxidoreductase [Halioglobus sp.]